jgi:hypothetical protein
LVGEQTVPMIEDRLLAPAVLDDIERVILLLITRAALLSIQ